MRKGHSISATKIKATHKFNRKTRSKTQIKSAAFEVLENRTLMSNSVSLANGILSVQGDPTLSSNLNVSLTANGTQINANAGHGHQLTVPLSSVQQIQIIGGSGGDYVYIDQKIVLPATISSGDGNDSIRGGGGKNTIYAGNGNVWVSGRGSANYIQTGNGNDTVLGSAGPDTIVAGSGNDSLDGAAGNDSIIAGNGRDSLTGDAGNDTLFAGNGIDIVNGGVGDDQLHVGSGASTVIPGTGTNTVSLTGTAGTVIPSSGNNTVARSGTSSAGSTSSGSTSSGSTTSGSTGTTTSSSAGSTTSGSTTSGSTTSGSTTSGSATSGSTTTNSGSSSSSSSAVSSSGTIPNNTPARSTSGSTTQSTGTITASGASTSGSTTTSSGNSTGTTTGSTTGTVTGSTGTGGFGAVSSPSGSTDWSTYYGSANGGTRAAIQVLAPVTSVGIGVVVRGLESTLGSGTPIDANYQWNFGDSSGEYNTLTGFNASHIYTQPGTYTISLTVTSDSHQSSTATATINITGDTRRPIYVNSATGSDSNDGSSPDQAVKTALRASNLVGDNTEVLFARGQTFNLGSTFRLSYRNVVVGAYGSGAQPIINYTLLGTGTVIFSTNNSAADGVTIENLTMTTQGGSSSNTKMPMAVMAGGYDTSVLGCTFLYVEYDVNASPAPTGLTLFDNSSPLPQGVAGYFLWDQGEDTTVINNYVNGSVKEHVMRTSGADELLVADNNFTNRDGKGGIEIHEGSYAWVDGNTVYGGDIRVGPLGLWGESTTLITNQVVIQNNHVNGTDVAVYPGSENISIRNNIITRNGGQLIDVIGQDGLGRQSANIFILNNTGINTASTGQFLKVENHTDGITLINNLLIQPTLATGGYAAGPVSLPEGNLSSFSYVGGNVWQQPQTFYYPARDGGVNLVGGTNLTPSAWNGQGVVGTDFFSATPITSDDAPEDGSLASNIDAPVAGVFGDINGNSRPASGWSAGAVQS